MTGKLKEVFGIYINDRRQQGEGMSAQEYRRIIAVDFDGTLAETKFPEIIKPIPKMIRHCRRLQRGGAILILNTCRKGKDLQDAVEWCAPRPAALRPADHIGGGACCRAGYSDRSGTGIY